MRGPVDSLERALDALVPAFDEPGAWADVLERAGEPRRGRRRERRALALGVAVVAVVALAASAYALSREFRVGDPAPPELKQEVGRVNVSAAKGEIIPRIEHESPEAIVDRLRLGAALRTYAGPVYLWVAPDASGGECRYVWRARDRLPDGRPNYFDGGCGHPRDRLDVGLEETSTGDSRTLRLLDGAAPPGTAALSLRFGDGSRERIHVSGRYFLVEWTSRPTLVEALDARGRVLDRFAVPNASPRPQAVGRFHAVLALRTRPRGEPLALSVAPGAKGTTCEQIRARTWTSGGCNRLPGLAPAGLEIGLTQVGSRPNGLLFLSGRVGGAVSSLEVRYEDGTPEPMRLRDGWTLHQITRDHWDPGSRPVVIIARDAGGDVIARKPLGPWRGSD